jgi:hypothetical protein
MIRHSSAGGHDTKHGTTDTYKIVHNPVSSGSGNSTKAKSVHSDDKGTNMQ